MDAETVHHLSFKVIRFLNSFSFGRNVICKLFQIQSPVLEREVFGLKFSNPIGLAAGFDKDAVLIDEFANFGFGFVEIGTLTPKAQEGNPKKRLFRLVKDQAVINRMGFNNKGVLPAIERLKNKKSNVIVGGNIGKNKVTENENAVSDYLFCFHELFDYVDYFVVNVSSPNTPNLRDLQEKEPLTRLLTILMNENRKKSNPKPILLKIAPDLGNEQLDDIVDIIQTTGISGVIATNTTVSRNKLETHWERVNALGNGGLSGKPLTDRSTDVIRYLSQKSNRSFPIIGVGGIMNEKDALDKLEAGASLIQLYTGFIYEGPGLIKRINKALIKKNNKR